jgi:hypothetical protein
MNATYNGCEILQVSRGQCMFCRARSVFSVLVSESTCGADAEHRRTFYTCERSLIPRRYFAHECQGDLSQECSMSTRQGLLGYQTHGPK